MLSLISFIWVTFSTFAIIIKYKIHVYVGLFKGTVKVISIDTLIKDGQTQFKSDIIKAFI